LQQQQQQQHQQQQGHMNLQNLQQNRTQSIKPPENLVSRKPRTKLMVSLGRLVPQTVTQTQPSLAQNQGALTAASPTNIGSSQNQIQVPMAGSSAPPPSAQSFTPNQLATLRHQIVAFKYISRNMSL